jgi:hypothetical protein
MMLFLLSVHLLSAMDTFTVAGSMAGHMIQTGHFHQVLVLLVGGLPVFTSCREIEFSETHIQDLE